MSHLQMTCALSREIYFLANEGTGTERSPAKTGFAVRPIRLEINLKAQS